MGGRWRACKGVGGSRPDMPGSIGNMAGIHPPSTSIQPTAGYVAEAEQGLELPPVIMHNLQKVPPASLLQLPPLPAIQPARPDGWAPLPVLPPPLLLHCTSA